MAANSKIEWTDATWNPIRGTLGKWHCTKVSEACQNCYAEAMNKRFSGLPYTKNADVLRLDVDVLLSIRKWKKPRKIFVCSMTDLFHEDLDMDSILRVFGAMCSLPQHTFQVLTKRPERAVQFCYEYGLMPDPDFGGMTGSGNDWPGNVWFGVTAENQQRADERIPHLLKVPAPVRFLSVEPMLGPIEIKEHLVKKSTHHVCMDVSGAIRNKGFYGLVDMNGKPLSEAEAKAELLSLQAKGVKLIGGSGCDRFDPDAGCLGHPLPSIDWVICGGESGMRARPLHPDWVRSLRDQCEIAGVPFFFKQFGEWIVDTGFSKAPRMWALPDGTILPDRHVSMDSVGWWPLRRVGKKATGRLLDGEEWNEFPETMEVAK